jgi:hypothetical protein
MEVVAIVGVFGISTITGWALAKAALTGVFAALGKPRIGRQ